MKKSEYGSVLIVDDDQRILELATFFLTREGVEVHCAADGEEALSKIRERTFAMMITDLNMPGMDGLELARKARENARRREEELSQIRSPKRIPLPFSKPAPQSSLARVIALSPTEW